MRNKEVFRIRVYEIPKDQIKIYSRFDEGNHLDRLVLSEVHGFTLVEDREEGFVPVAITVFSLKKDCLSVEWLYVSETHRRLGYGERLLYECFLAAKREGKSRVEFLLSDEMLYMSNYLYDIGFSPTSVKYEWRFDDKSIPYDMSAAGDVILDKCAGIGTISAKEKSKILKEMSPEIGGIIYDAGPFRIGDDEAGCVIFRDDNISGMIRLIKLKNTWLCTMVAADEIEDVEAMIQFTLDDLLDRMKSGEDICFTGIDENISRVIWNILKKRKNEKNTGEEKGYPPVIN